jgi:hypothetical protein
VAFDRFVEEAADLGGLREVCLVDLGRRGRELRHVVDDVHVDPEHRVHRELDRPGAQLVGATARLGDQHGTRDHVVGVEAPGIQRLGARRRRVELADQLVFVGPGR